MVKNFSNFRPLFTANWAVCQQYVPNILFQCVNRLGLICVYKRLHITPQKKSSGVKSHNLRGHATGARHETKILLQ